MKNSNTNRSLNGHYRRNMNYKTTALAALSAIGVCFALAGCGGGDGSAGMPATPSPILLPTGALQGIWSGTLGNDAASAVVLSSGKTWLITNSTPVKLYAASLQGTSSAYGATGQQYISGSSADVVWAATPVAKSSLTGTITATGGLPVAYNLTYQSRFESAASMSDIAGTWQGTQAAGSLAVAWVISAAGVVTQGVNNSSGCLYSGEVAVHMVPVPVGVYDLRLQEVCTALGVSTTKDFVGIVTLNEAKTSATFAFVRSDAGNVGLEGYALTTLKQ